MVETVTEYQLRLTLKALVLVKYAEMLMWGSVRAAHRHKEPTLSTRILGASLLVLRVFLITRAKTLRYLKFEERRPIYDWSTYLRA